MDSQLSWNAAEWGLFRWGTLLKLKQLPWIIWKLCLQFLGEEEEQKCVDGLEKLNLAITSQNDHEGKSLSDVVDLDISDYVGKFCYFHFYQKEWNG